MSQAQFREGLREEVAPLKLRSTLSDMSVIVQQALHKRNGSPLDWKKMMTQLYFLPAPRTLPSGTLAVVLFHAECKAYSFCAP